MAILTIKTETKIQIGDDLTEDDIEKIVRAYLVHGDRGIRHRRSEGSFSWRTAKGRLPKWRGRTAALLKYRAWVNGPGGSLRIEAGPITPAMKRDALKWARGSCPGCRKPWERIKLPSHRVQPVDFHHRKHVAKRGKTTKENIIALCLDCHKKVHAGAQ